MPHHQRPRRAPGDAPHAVNDPGDQLLCDETAEQPPVAIVDEADPHRGEDNGRWQAAVMDRGDVRYLGGYSTRAEAVAVETAERARIEAARVPRQTCVQTSQYRGVHVQRRMSKRTGSMRLWYQAKIRPPGGSSAIYLGVFTVEEHGSWEAAEHAAARAHDKRARELYGEVKTSEVYCGVAHVMILL